MDEDDTQQQPSDEAREQSDDRFEREVPALLVQAWETATGDGDPLEALGATRALRAHLSTWEAQLVKEAMGDGATWETIGSSVGVSRQAAWDRFHHEVHDLRRQRRKDMEDLKRKFRDDARELHRRIRDEVGDPTRRGRGRSRRHHEHDDA